MNKTKKKIRWKKRVIKAGLFLMLLFSYSCVAFAAGNVTEVINPINNFSSLLQAVVKAIGMCVVCLGGLEFGNSLQTQDGAARSHALLRIAGGLFMVGIGPVVSMLIG